ALLTAWNKIQATYILQLDADVRLTNKWYTALRKAFDHDAALYILPIKFEINTFIQKLFAFEFASLSMLTISSVGLNNPLLANGAHLMYERRYLDQIDKRKDWMQTASGDDMSILHHFKEQNLTINTIISRDLFCETKSKDTLKEFMQQRLRWASKTRYNLFSIQGITSLFIILSNALFIICAFCFLCSKSHILMNASLTYILVKIIADFIYFLPILNQSQRLNQWWLYFILVPLYPIYVIYIGILSMFSLGNWK
ncbi:MAG: glycosyltransferase family 2 protein, partial [Bacteroidota bacterium]